MTRAVDKLASQGPLRYERPWCCRQRGTTRQLSMRFWSWLGEISFTLIPGQVRYEVSRPAECNHLFCKIDIAKAVKRAR